uniref:NADH-ubiquinone oxidoreductase chain 4 n=1 Tax=Vincenzellus ruficollis TaxID=295991 RepID=A0A343A422_9CUCU|nr:NADH dehydrogenase subunit 4 [Vincenzellus ruficollis]AOY39300.1 NADH dehydrogenase subunit 4 [Vincenzellus ruficollis]
MLMGIIFMMPLSLMMNFWLIQVMWLNLSLLVIFKFSFNWMIMDISYGLGLDLMSYLLVLLSFWICSLMIMASQKIFKLKNWENLFLLMIMLLVISLYVTFSSLNLFVFYLFFEISLIPTLMLIIGWGYQPERLQAGIYLLFYTLLASLPMMISIFFCYKNNCTLEFQLMKIQIESVMLYLCMNMVFFVKMPMFFLHLWLPKAHVEASVAGSMILAGLMLKLGGYGFLRILPMFMKLGMHINMFFISLSMIGGMIISLICLRQSDMKSLIAYSSVSHMGMALGGMMTLSYWGLTGSLVMMIAHGLCSSGLFCLANISYERLHSRSLFLNKGLINILPNLSLWWFLLVSSNMAAPPSLNLLSEIMLINSLVCFNNLNMVFLMFMSFFSAVYSLYLYAFSQHGKLSLNLSSFFSGQLREYLLLLLHWLPLNVLIVKGDFLSLWV